MKTIEVGSYFKLQDNVRLHVDDIQVDLLDGGHSVWIYCHQEDAKEGIATDSEPYTLSQFKELINYKNEHLQS